MQSRGKLAIAIAFELVLVTTPWMFPQLPDWMGWILYGTASVLFVYGGVHWLLVHRRKSSARANDARIPRYPDIKLTPAALSAYVQGSPRVKRIDDTLAADLRLSVDYSDPGSVAREEKVRAAGITNTATLDRLLEENERYVIRLSHYRRPKGSSMDSGYCIDVLFEVLMAQAGVDKFKRFIRSAKYCVTSEEWADETIAAYESIRSKEG